MEPKSALITYLRNGITTFAAILMAIFAIYLFAPSDNHNLDAISTATVGATQSPDTESENVELEDQPLPPDPALVLLQNALTAFENRDMETVLSARNKMTKGSLDRQLLTWLIATSGNSKVSASSIRDAQQKLKDWPGQTKMVKNLERAMSRDGFSAMRLRLSLGNEPPKTFQAAFAIARTFLVTRNSEKVRELIIPFWHAKALSASDEKRVLAKFGDILTKRDHEIRFFNMMSRDRIKSGGRVAAIAEMTELHKAWTAVIRRQKAASVLINELEEKNKKSAAYALMRVQHFRHLDNDDEAIKVFEEMPQTAEFAINPNAWWDERRIISRHKFEAGDAQAAYDLVSTSAKYNDLKTQVDAAFHAGWYALRGLKNAELAIPHFQRITKIAKGNVSLARGYYWMGRSLSEEEAAIAAYEKAATYGTTFYGQLASATLGQELGTMGLPVSASDRTGVVFPAPLRAIERLSEAGFSKQVRALYLALGWSLESPSILRWAADHAATNNDYYAALKIAKSANWRGIEVGGLTHPLGAISNATGLNPSDHALAYAVARQESEFNVAAVSRANAKGLLQLLPGTAKEMARRQKLAYTPAKLTTDANYNARLGAAYLNQQLAKFDGSYVLTFAAYNAGPGRANEWIKRFGDPRGESLESVIDWIEMIPFPETRSYVQRIIENFQVYKVQLGQDTSIVADLVIGARTDH